MRKRLLFTVLFCAATALTSWAQNSVESIRKAYQEMHEQIVRMTPDENGETAMPQVYFDLQVLQNLPGTGPHRENIRMFYGEDESAEDLIYPPHWLCFVTAKYNFAAREFYEEYLYDDKGQVMFIYAITPDVGDDFIPYELRLWFDGKRLLRFTAKKVEGQGGFDIASLRKAPFKEVYSGTSIPEQYRQETDRCKQRAKRFLTMFKGIDDNTYL